MDSKFIAHAREFVKNFSPDVLFLLLLLVQMNGDCGTGSGHLEAEVLVVVG